MKKTSLVILASIAIVFLAVSVISNARSNLIFKAAQNKPYAAIVNQNIFYP